MHRNSIITGTGCYIPEKMVPNEAFVSNDFLKAGGVKVEKEGSAIISKLEQISGIRRRRYVSGEEDTAFIAAQAGMRALEDAGLNGDDLDGIIVTHNFGNLSSDQVFAHLVPNLAAVVKKKMGITNHRCSAYDILFGCPGWLEAMILAHQRIATGNAEKILVIGVEVISPRLDPHDLDSMLFGDGAGATVVEAEESEQKRGVLTYETFSHCSNGEVDYIQMSDSYNEELNGSNIFVKMNGRKVYRYAVTYVPELVKNCLAKAKVPITKVKKILMHQANEKMIHAIAEKVFAQHNVEGDVEQMVPFSVQDFGNSSVATIPTLLDLIFKGKKEGHEINEGDLVVFGAVGAGMHANCMVYQF